MILLIAVVQTEDVAKLSQNLVEHAFRVTQINASGGFLAAGNSVLLVGVVEWQIPFILAIIETTCHTRTRYVSVAPWPGAVGMHPVTALTPLEVPVGGAVVFGLPVKRFARLAQAGGTSAPGGVSPMISSPASATVTGSATPASTDNPVMNLVVAIVQDEDAGAVIDALLAAGHRLTRVNSAGGFLRRGNATLLIGVEAQRVDEVFSLIQTSCRPRTEPTPIREGMPMYGATVFVLEASHFIRF